MAIELPSKETRILSQNNRSSVLGVIDESFNLDLTDDLGVVQTTRMKKVFDAADDANFDSVYGIKFFNSKWYVGSDEIWEGSTMPSDAYTRLSTGGAPTNIRDGLADMEIFNGHIVVCWPDASSNQFYHYRYDGTTWTSNTFSTGVSQKYPNKIASFGDLLYVAYDGIKIGNIDVSDVWSDADGSNTSTLNLGIPSTYQITFMEAGLDKLWIGVTNTEGEDGIVFTWDGQTVNTPTARFDVEAGILAGVMRDNIPYILDANLRLMAFNGASFQEVARFPAETFQITDARQRNNVRCIHPNGMTVADGKILINIINTIGDDDGITNVPPRMPSGIWEYDTDTGLYHKWSFSYSAVGSTSYTDFGQIMLDSSGAIEYRRPDAIAGAGEDDGYVVAGCEYYNSAGTAVQALGVNNSSEDTEKWGYFSTIKLFSGSILDTWKKVYAIYDKLLNTGDEIMVKYKTVDDDPTQATATWTSTTTFTVPESTDLSSYSAGDEVQILRGTGAGQSSHISSITRAAGKYTVVLEDTVTGATGTGSVRLEKWISAGKAEYVDGAQYHQFDLPKQNESPWIKIKVVMHWTGRNKLHKLRVINEPVIKE